MSETNSSSGTPMMMMSQQAKFKVPTEPNQQHSLPTASSTNNATAISAPDFINGHFKANNATGSVNLEVLLNDKKKWCRNLGTILNLKKI